MKLGIELRKLHVMMDQLYETHPCTKRGSDVYQMIDEQYSKVFRELKARNVFKEGDFDGRDTNDIY